jgi:peptide-methionine (S)-S-oxide reductase
VTKWTAADVRAYDERAPTPEGTATATFALGCFWGPDATFGALPGVVRTRVGYAGGTTSEPTYHDIGDHSEAVQVDYDPAVTSFADLLDVAVANHDPTRQPDKRQYHSILFYDDDAERAAIEERLAALSVPEVATRVEPLGSFTVAEPYHQTFSLADKRYATAAFDEAGYDDADVRESPAAAKLNALLAGRDVPDLGALAGRETPEQRG